MMTHHAKRQASANLPCMSHFDSFMANQVLVTLSLRISPSNRTVIPEEGGADPGPYVRFIG